MKSDDIDHARLVAMGRKGREATKRRLRDAEVLSAAGSAVDVVGFGEETEGT